MNDNYLIKQESMGNYRISVYYDTDAECPCTSCDLLGVHLFNNGDSDRLSASCDCEEVNSDSLCGALRELVCKYVSLKNIAKYINEYVSDMRVRYDRSDHMWYVETYSCYLKHWSVNFDLTPDEYANGHRCEEIVENLDSDDLVWLLENCQREIAVYSWHSKGYSQGDYVEGFSFCDKERFSKRYDKPDKDWRAKAVECMGSETEHIGKWMWGGAMGFVLEKKVPFRKVYAELGRTSEDSHEWEEIDSCWDYYCDDADQLIQEVISEHGLNATFAA